MPSIRVIVQGVLGKMGQEVLFTVCRTDGMHVVGASDKNALTDSLNLPDGSGTVPLSTSLADVIDNADVVVDFSDAEGALTAIRTAPFRKVGVVIGSTGNPDSTFEEAKTVANENQVGILIAPNFALGAVLMIHLAREAARFFDYADLTEIHHEGKIDAPSGTSLAIAAAAAEGKGKDFIAPEAEKQLVPNTRGGESSGVVIHSARMPGRVAHHELIFGAVGQTLTLRHDSVNRESFMPGVTMAIRHVATTPGFVLGLDKIMGL